MRAREAAAGGGDGEKEEEDMERCFQSLAPRPCPWYGAYGTIQSHYMAW